MTIQEQTPRNTAVGNGVTTTFPFTFKAINTSYVKVTIDNVLQTENSDYTIQNLTDIGGDVVFTVAPAVNEVIEIYRDTPLSQDVDYTAYDPFPAETHEGALDKLTAIVQELDTIIKTVDPSRSLQLDPTNTFWDAVTRQIKNVGTPVAPTDAATKAYADSLSQGFDPTVDRTITGTWTFTNEIGGTCSGNLVASDLLPYVRNDEDEVISGNWTFSVGTTINDADGVAKKVGYRNPTAIDIGTARNLTQSDEARILICSTFNSAYVMPTLEKDTTMRFLIITTGVTFTPGTGVFMNVLDGSGALVSAPNGVAVAQNSVVEIVYTLPTQVYVFGQGISVLS